MAVMGYQIGKIAGARMFWENRTQIDTFFLILLADWAVEIYQRTV